MNERIVRVEWWDTKATDGRWYAPERAARSNLSRCVTVGLLLWRDRRMIRLASSWSDDRDGADEVSHVTTIPAGCVANVRRLYEKGAIMPGKNMKSIKNPKVYEKLRDERGMSKEKAAKISNSQAAKGGKKK